MEQAVGDNDFPQMDGNLSDFTPQVGPETRDALGIDDRDIQQAGNTALHGLDGEGQPPCLGA